MYTITTGVIRRNSDGAFIPEDPDNHAYKQYLIDIANDPDCVTTEITSLDLTAYKATAKEQIDRAAEVSRLKYITPGYGQAMTYLNKAAEAAAYIAAGYPSDLTNYPYIEADSTALGITPTQAADAIIATRNAWIALSADIEYARLFGKRSVDGQMTEQSVLSEMNYAINAIRAI